jgi:hypothetical protein
MDAGGRATQQAKAERRGDEAIQNAWNDARPGLFRRFRNDETLDRPGLPKDKPSK